jgi:hypothetical protein
MGPPGEVLDTLSLSFAGGGLTASHFSTARLLEIQLGTTSKAIVVRSCAD